MATKVTKFVQENLDALKTMNIADMVEKGRQAVESKDLDLAASYVSVLAYPALGVYELRRASAWAQARKYLEYDRTFDDTCHFVIKLKAVYAEVSKFLKPPTWQHKED